LTPKAGETWLLDSAQFVDLTYIAAEAGLLDVVRRTSKPVGYPHDADYPADHYLLRLTSAEGAQLRTVFNPDV
jgi:hypothetical protein